MKILNLNKCSSSPGSKEWESVPEIKEDRPKNKGFVEVSLQILDGLPKGVTLVQWHGAKNGFWYAASDIFMVKGKK